MTRARITAAQTTRPPKGMRMHRGTVTAVTPLTVQIAGGGAVTGLAVPGQTYKVGDAVMVAVQEPAVGPVYPLAPTAPPDLSPYAKTADLPATTTAAVAPASGTSVANWAAGQNVLTRYGPLVAVKWQINVGSTVPANGWTLGNIPTGFRPTSITSVRAILYNNGWNQSADLQIDTTGAIILNGTTVAMAAGYGIFLNTTYTAA